MRRSIIVFAFSSFLLAAGDARAFELIEVLSGGEILVLHEGRRVTLELAGVWVPEAPRPGVQGEYRGAEARELVEDLFYSEPVYIREVEPLRPGADTVKVRIRVGESGDYDLAVSLAYEGLGLSLESTGVGEEYLRAVYQAERSARRAARGMHDGGYGDYRRSRDRSVVNYGVGTVGATPGRAGFRAYGDGGDPSTSGNGEGASRGGRDRPVRSAQAGIRDWGRRMGLPVDSSSAGR